MRNTIRAVLAALAVLALSVAMAACGSDDKKSGGSSSGGSTSGSGTEIQKNPDNASKTVTVGSKNFTEQFVLGEI